MFNFRNLFRNESVDDIIHAIKERGPIDMTYVNNEKATPEALFKVGMNPDGLTQLTVGHPSSITLTMNDASVAHMIKLLAVNIDHAYTVTIKENSQE